VFYLYSPQGVTCLALPTPYWLENVNFSHPLSFSALVWGDPFQIYGKALGFLAVDGKDMVILACTVFD